MRETMVLYGEVVDGWAFGSSELDPYRGDALYYGCDVFRLIYSGLDGGTIRSTF
jgi:hypothetical protein